MAHRVIFDDTGDVTNLICDRLYCQTYAIQTYGIMLFIHHGIYFNFSPQRLVYFLFLLQVISMRKYLWVCNNTVVYFYSLMTLLALYNSLKIITESTNIDTFI